MDATVAGAGVPSLATIFVGVEGRRWVKGAGVALGDGRVGEGRDNPPPVACSSSSSTVDRAGPKRFPERVVRGMVEVVESYV